jgi:hypothetical protein
MAEKTYRGYDNINDLLLKADGVAQDISSITKAAFIYNGKEFNSTNFATAFDWSTDGSDGVIHLKIGKIGSSIDVGRDKEAELILYDANYPNGHVWGTFDLQVFAIVATEVT